MQHLVSVNYYASLCGVTPKTISERIKQGRVKYVVRRVNNRRYRYISIKQYPPKPDLRRQPQVPATM